MSLHLVGAVLAGGASRRFGSPKAAHPLAGVPLVTRALRTVRGVVETVVLVGGDAGVPLLRGIPGLPDARPQRGPLAGLESALTHARDLGASGAIVLACDLPMVAPPVLAALAAAWAAAPRPQATIALVSDAESGDQPLLAVWGSDVLDDVRAALDADRWAVRDLVASLEDERRVVRVAAGSLAAEVGLGADALLANVNRPDDLAGLGAPPLPVVVTVTGWKDSGKTSVAVALVAALRARGIDAVAAKHGHRFRLDHEGTDSWRLRHEAGARAVLLAGPDDVVLQRVGPTPGLAALVRTHLADAAVVVAEGWKSEAWPTIGVSAATPGAPALPELGVADAQRRLATVVQFDEAMGGRLAGVVIDRFGLGPD